MRFHVIRMLLYVILIYAIATLGASTFAQGIAPLDLRSGAFPPNAAIPGVYTCVGADHSPPLSWTGAPATTKSFALIVTDPDAPHGTFVHWVIYNIPESRKDLPENVPGQDKVLGGEQGANGFDKIGFGGPCPPPGTPHHYRFRLYALDAKLNLKPGATAAQVEQAMKGHLVASSDLVGTFGR